MRFVLLIKADQNTEAGVLPSKELVAAMGQFNEEMVNAGVLLAAEGLHPSSKGARLKFSAGERTVIDGPFTETKELVAGFWKDVADLEPQEIDWRPHPQANSLNVMIQHLRIEAQWQLASLENAEPMLLEATAPIQSFIDSIPFDSERNLMELEQLCTRFIAVLRTKSPAAIAEQHRLVYREFPGEAPPEHFLG